MGSISQTTTLEISPTADEVKCWVSLNPEHIQLCRWRYPVEDLDDL
jgi:hypothetical protein